MTEIASDSVAVIGGGIVGVSCALFLNRQGFKTTLIEKTAPGRETSYGNAGAISQASFIPINSPRILRNLHRFASNKTNSVRYDPAYLARNAGWMARFLLRARRSSFMKAADEMSAFAYRSRAVHLELARQASVEHRFRDTGWMKLYRSQAGFDGSLEDQELMRSHGVGYDVLGPKELSEIEPHLKPIYAGAVLITSASNVDSPGGVTEAYAALFEAEGGIIQSQQVQRIDPSGDGFTVVTDQGSTGFAQVVVAAGPWSADLLKPLGYNIPLAYERGYHQHFQVRDGQTLYRACNDIEGAFSMSPMERGIRVTSGIQFAERDAPPDYSQIQAIFPAAEQAISLGSAVENQPWSGSRPSLPDTRPVIGSAARHKGLWMAFGHGHIGFGTGPITGKLLAQMVADKPTDIPMEIFRPARFGA